MLGEAAFSLSPEDLILLKIITKEEFEKLPDVLRAEYTEKDGKYVPQVEGMVPESELTTFKGKVTEFRDNNVRIMKENDELKGKLKTFEGINVDEYNSLKSENEKLKQFGAGSVSDLPKVIEGMITKAVTPLKEKLETSEREKQETANKLRQKAVDEYITGFAVKAGVDPDVLPDVLQRARQVFVSKDEQVVAMKGDLPVYSAQDPSKPLGAEEWLSTALPKAFFKPSAGGGANGDGGRPGPGKTLVKPDAKTFGQNLEEIANGKIAVSM